MRIFLIVGIVLFFLNSSVSAYSMQKNQTVAGQNDSLYAAGLFDMAWAYRDANPDSARHYAIRSLRISERKGFKTLQAYNNSVIGNYYSLREEYDSALYYLKKSLQIRLDHLDSSGIASGYNNLGNLYNQLERYDSASYWFSTGLSYLQNKPQSHTRAAILSGLSMTMLNQFRIQEAEEYLTEAIQITERSGDSASLAKRYQNLGKLYDRVRRFRLAEEYYSKAYDIYENQNNVRGIADILINQGALLFRQGNNESAIDKYKQSMELGEQYDLRKNRATLFNNLGYAYMLNGQSELAESMFDRGIELATADGKHHAFVETGLNLMRLYIEQQRFNEIIDFLPEIGRRIEAGQMDRYLPDYYTIETQTYAGLGQFKEAYSAQLRYNEIRESQDSLIDQAQMSLAENERMKRDEQILLDQNALQELTIREKEAQSDKRLYAIIALLLVLVFSVGYLLMRTRTIRVKAKALAEKKKSDERLVNVLRQVDVELLETQIAANNETSYKIGQELHDNLGSKLAVVQMSMDGIRKKIKLSDNDITSRFDEVEQLLEESCDDLRNIAHNLQDHELKHRGLLDEIELYTRLINESEGLKVHFVPAVIPSGIGDHTQKELLATVRLLIENVLRHSDAEDVTVRIANEPETLVVSVEDNGCGFNPEEVAEQGGRGLLNARTRMEKIGGEFILLSQQGLGTRATIRIPLNSI